MTKEEELLYNVFGPQPTRAEYLNIFISEVMDKYKVDKAHRKLIENICIDGIIQGGMDEALFEHCLNIKFKD